MNTEMAKINKKINFTIKILPWFMGFSGDLLFWVAINTIFLTTVKGFNAAQISSLTTISNLVAIILYPLSFRIIKKIGNVNSIKLGTSFLLLSSLLMTFCNTYLYILFGYILYDLAFLFKNMDNVILRKNLKYKNQENNYIKLQCKSSFIYSFLTMIIAFVAGSLFNVNHYLPMILCITFCILNVISSNFLYECKDKQEEQIKVKEKNKLPIVPIILFIFILYALLYAVIDLGQPNSKLFIQYNLTQFLDIGKVSIFLSLIIAGSRIVRVVSNYSFTKYCKKESKNLLYKIGYALIMAFILLIFGNLIKLNFVSIFIMSIGFFILLGVRDIFSNYIKTLLLNNCEEKYHQQAITYLTLSRKVGKFLISTLITLILLKIDMMYVMIFLLIISILNILIIKKIYKLVERK